jgi:putative tryptophan/tyrosine transport system substrate-binding protein
MSVRLFLLISLIVVSTILFITYKKTESNLPIIAIANYGPHSSLDSSIQGIQQELKKQGFIDGENIIYDIKNVGFDSNLIPQMIAQLKARKPAVMVAMTTPVAQFAKHAVKNTPLIFNVITDPVEAGLLKDVAKTENNMTCTSDKQDLSLLLDFAKHLLPKATRVGVLYSTAESNDRALVKMLKIAAEKANMQVVAVPIDQARDVLMRMQSFKDKVDFIYVGTSGPIQPTLPTIISEANKMNIPVFNANEESVQKNQALASFGVNYLQIGVNTGKVIADLLNGKALSSPIYPDALDHHGFISKKKAEFFDIKIPSDFTNVTIVE